jgi:hypothetical protein
MLSCNSTFIKVLAIGRLDLFAADEIAVAGGKISLRADEIKSMMRHGVFLFEAWRPNFDAVRHRFNIALSSNARVDPAQDTHVPPI